jgi:transcriptional regulator with XRE-family HTH domain
MSESLADRVRFAIRVEMLRRGVTGQALAAILGVSDNWVSRHLNGHTDFTLADLERVAAGLDVDVEQLVAQAVTVR